MTYSQPQGRINKKGDFVGFYVVSICFVLNVAFAAFSNSAYWWMNAIAAVICGVLAFKIYETTLKIQNIRWEIQQIENIIKRSKP